MFEPAHMDAATGSAAAPRPSPRRRPPRAGISAPTAKQPSPAPASSSPVFSGRAIRSPQQQRPQQRSDEHLHLHHQRRQRRAHADLQCNEQEAELPRALQQAVCRQPADADRRRPHPQRERKQREEKARGAELEGGESRSPSLIATKFRPQMTMTAAAAARSRPVKAGTGAAGTEGHEGGGRGKPPVCSDGDRPSATRRRG